MAVFVWRLGSWVHYNGQGTAIVYPLTTVATRSVNKLLVEL